MQLPDILTEERKADAACFVRQYFTSSRSGRYFEAFAGGGDRDEVANTITAEDLISTALLAVPIPGDAALGILGEAADAITENLKVIPRDVELADATPDMFDDRSPAAELWRIVRASGAKRWGIGPTRASKILARKRPKLIPIYDSVVASEFHLKTSSTQWVDWHRILNEDGGALQSRLIQIRKLAALDTTVSTLRVLDVAVWMNGTGAEPIKSG